MRGLARTGPGRLVALALLVAIAAISRSSFVAPIDAQTLSTVRATVVLAVSGSPLAELRGTDDAVDRLVRSGTLRLRERRDDPLVPDRIHERLQQYHQGLPVFGGEVVRQLRDGQLVSAFGEMYQDIAIDVQPTITRDDVVAALRVKGLTQRHDGGLELLVLPTNTGRYALAYKLHAYRDNGDPITVFVDATNASVLLTLSGRYTQSAVGQGTGVLGDLKKISTVQQAGTYMTHDLLRPPLLMTFNLYGDVNRTLGYLKGTLDLGAADLGSQSDNVWSDGAVVDAHVYQGWVYDYYFKRFQRRGLDSNNIAMRSLVHPVRLGDFASLYRDHPEFYSNAFYDDGCRCMVYGEGLPGSVQIEVNNRRVGLRNFSAALDVVAHELTHAVTDNSSTLEYENESGALNEAFSDIMGTSAEFFYQPPGAGPMKADYAIGEDLLFPWSAAAAFRSMSNPTQFDQPDHYSARRYIGATVDFDHGGVHDNSGIANHAFYLAIEGGTNRVSGLPVQGVGAANRAQIEKVFYRAFTSMLPKNATFYTARTATIQSARDQFGSGSQAERAVTEAWDAVGVTSPGAAVTTRFSPHPAPAGASCGGASPGFRYTVTVSEFQNVGFTVAEFDLLRLDESFRLLGAQTLASPAVEGVFGKTRIPAGSQLSSSVQCVDLGGRSGGYVLYEFRGTDDNGNPGTFLSDFLELGTAPATASADTSTFKMPNVGIAK